MRRDIISEALLRDTVSRVATDFKCSHDDVEIAYGCTDGVWCWTIRVHAAHMKHGRGRRLIRPEGVACWDTLERAELVARERAWAFTHDQPIPDQPEKVAGRKK